MEKFEQLISIEIEVIQRPKGLEYFESSSFVPAEMEQVLKVQHLIALHFKEERSPGFYLERIGMTEKCLNARLKVLLEKTLYELIQDRIHDEALKLLLHSHITIRQISFELESGMPVGSAGVLRVGLVYVRNNSGYLNARNQIFHVFHW